MKMTFVLYEGVEPIDLAALGVISMARRVIPEVSYETTSVSLDPVLFSNGLRVLPDRRFADIDSTDLLLIPGGPGWRMACENQELLAFIRTMAPRALVCSVCTGAMILAAAGLLNGLQATTKNEVVAPEASPLQELQQRYPDIQVTNALLVDSGRIITGGGVSLCIDAVLHVLQQRFGESPADEVARILEYRDARAANRRRLATRLPL